MFWYYIDPWREIFLDMEMGWWSFSAVTGPQNTQQISTYCFVENVPKRT